MKADLMTAKEVCMAFGGSRPIHQSTLYRGIKEGRFPKPIKLGPKSNRWHRHEVEALIRELSNNR